MKRTRIRLIAANKATEVLRQVSDKITEPYEVDKGEEEKSSVRIDVGQEPIIVADRVKAQVNI